MEPTRRICCTRVVSIVDLSRRQRPLRDLMTSSSSLERVFDNCSHKGALMLLTYTLAGQAAHAPSGDPAEKLDFVVLGSTQ